MFTVQIEHPVPNFDAWKQFYDSDPLGREKSGVRRSRVFRPIDDPQYALTELEFGALADAEAFVLRLRDLWRGVAGTILTNPRVRIVEEIETEAY